MGHAKGEYVLVGSNIVKLGGKIEYTVGHMRREERAGTGSYSKGEVRTEDHVQATVSGKID